jgi:hypothetical protein
MYRGKKFAGQKAPLKARSSPAIIPSTPEAPIRQTAPSTSAPKISKMAEALAKDAMPIATPTKGSKRVSFGKSLAKKVGIAEEAGDAAKWKKRAGALFHLDTLQEEASNQISSALTLFVQTTSVVKEVCTPCIPRAPWWILVDNSSWCS